jgi:hypothetical protein
MASGRKVQIADGYMVHVDEILLMFSDYEHILCNYLDIPIGGGRHLATYPHIKLVHLYLKGE